jgi:hypothetical protein
LFDPCSARVSPEEDANATALSEGIALWNRAAQLKLSLADEDATAIGVRFQDAAGAFRGLYDVETGVVFVNRRLLSERARAITVAHELGHAFGLAHVSTGERASLMNPGNIVTAPTRRDVTELQALWGHCAATDASTPDASALSHSAETVSSAAP